MYVERGERDIDDTETAPYCSSIKSKAKKVSKIHLNGKAKAKVS